LALKDAKPPDLFCSLTSLLVDDPILDEALSIRTNLLVQPTLRQVRVQWTTVPTLTRLEISHPAVAALQSAKNVILVRCLAPVQNAQLGGALDASRGRLVEIDMPYIRGVYVFLD
jgi:hypothetical protein